MWQSVGIYAEIPLKNHASSANTMSELVKRRGVKLVVIAHKIATSHIISNWLGGVVNLLPRTWVNM